MKAEVVNHSACLVVTDETTSGDKAELGTVPRVLNRFPLWFLGYENMFVPKRYITIVFGAKLGIIQVSLCPLSSSRDVSRQQTRYVLVTNFMPTSTLTKSKHSCNTHLFPCFLVKTFRYFIPSVVSI